MLTENDMKKKLLLRQYQNIVDDTNIVSKADINGKITYVNSKFIEISGYSKKELIGKSHSVIRDINMPSKIFKELWDTIEAKKIWHGVVTNKKKDGTTYTVEASIFPILNESNEIIEYISIRHDITKLLELNKKLDDINNYKTEQELLAKSKLEAGIVNDLDETQYDVLYKASDIVSGDFYSIYKMNNGATFIYLIDGQGHGLSPALTVFAISSMLNGIINNINSMEELIEKLYQNSKKFLGDIEQLSYTMMIISPDKKSITYTSGGMYPFLIKTPDKVLRVKANNTPFMNFSDKPKCQTITVDEWETILLYTDGIVEHEEEDLKECFPDIIINTPAEIKKSLQKVSKYDLEDDVTIISVYNN